MSEKTTLEQEMWKLSDENKILKDNVRTLQEQLQAAYKRIIELRAANSSKE
jgi:cell division protein FtsB